MKQITFYYEPADGQPDRCTGVHVDHGDGTSSWLASGALDAASPPGAGKTWRQIGERARDDAKPMARFNAKPEPKAPAPHDHVRGNVQPVTR